MSCLIDECWLHHPAVASRDPLATGCGEGAVNADRPQTHRQSALDMAWASFVKAT